MGLTAKRKKGNNAENKARFYLEDAGLSFEQSNYNCKLGEIDLIMKDRDGALIFVEVRYRKNACYGGAALSVTHSKQQKLIRAAQHYLQRLPYCPACRFDVIAFEGNQVNWIRNAIAGF